MVLQAHVENGQIVLDDPTPLPEGAVVELRIVGAEMSLDERVELDAAIEEAAVEIDQGEVVSEEAVWAAVRAMRCA